MDQPRNREALTDAHYAAELLEFGDAFLEIDGAWHVVRVNGTFEKLSRLPRSRCLGRLIWDVWPDAARPDSSAWREYHRAMEERVPVQFEEYVAPLDMWTNVAAYPTSAGGVVAFVRDVTPAKRAEQALRESEAELRLAQRIAHVGSWSWIVGTTVVEASEEAFRIYGRAPGEPIPRNDSEALRRHYTAEGWERRTAAFRKALDDGLPWERDEQIIRPDGTVRWVHFRGEAQRDPAGRIVKLRGTIEDITDRKHTEDALRESEQRFRALADAMPQIVCMLSWDGTPEYVNPSWIAYSGLDSTAAAAAGWEAVVHPEDVAAVRACWRRARGEGTPQDVEVRYRAADGGYCWFLCRLAPIHDDDGRIVRFIGAGMNIDDRRRAEALLQRANEQLRDADRRKDEFLGMLSHELRNPLAPIRQSIYVLRHAPVASEQSRRAQDIIARQTDHLTRLVDDLLDVTRIARGKIELRPSRVDLRDVVLRAADDFRAMLGERGIAFRSEAPEECLWTGADVTRITQIVGNLLNNAAKFTPPGGEVTLSLRRNAGVAEIAVRDTGAGIDPALLGHVFDPFVQGARTLARTEGGLGLGLALAKGLAELHGGTIHAHSEGPGRGSEFTLRLPLATDAGTQPAIEGRPTSPPARRRVLVVDDNADAAESLAQLVELFGHDVEIAHDGPTALEKALRSPPDIVLCDLGLPGMSGYEVARALRASSGTAAVKLIAVSGYAQSEDVQRAVAAGFVEHLAKPPDPERIQRILA